RHGHSARLRAWRPRRRTCRGSGDAKSDEPWLLLSFRQRVQFKGADEQFEAFRLKENLPGRGEDIGSLVDGLAIDPDGDTVAVAQAFNLGPLAELALDVVLAAGVE